MVAGQEGVFRKEKRFRAKMAKLVKLAELTTREERVTRDNINKVRRVAKGRLSIKLASQQPITSKKP
jgi:hypothetical protein